MAAMFGHGALGGRITALPPSVIVIGTRRGSPLILGIGDDEYVLASPQGTDPREGSTTTTRRRACPGLFLAFFFAFVVCFKNQLCIKVSAHQIIV